jgi:WhiB family transcriptional regulator, redox-sensing transcriptional regulator
VNWREYAACRDEDTELFFKPGEAGKALMYCRRCPVICQCRELADNSESDLLQIYGVFGGETATERMIRRGARPLPRVPDAPPV